MRVFFAVLRRELADAVTSPFGQRLTIIHLAVSASAVFLGWPISYTLGRANAAPTLAWWVYAEIVVLSYLALAVPANIFPIEDKIRTGDWIVYGEAPIWAVYLGKTLASLLALAFWLLTVIPIFFTALAISPISIEQLQFLGLFVGLLLTAMVQLGTWIGVTVDSQTFRIVAVDVAFVAIMLGSILLQSLSGSFHIPIYAQPLEVAARIMNITVRDALVGSAAGTLVGLSVPLTTTPAASVSDSVPWGPLIVIYGSLLVFFLALSLLSLRQWRQNSGKEGAYFDPR